MKKGFLVAFTALFFNSCVIQIQGITNDYNKLNSNQKSTVQLLSSFDTLHKKNIYKVNAHQLLEEIKKHPKALVYTFANGCQSDVCRPLIFYENFAKENGYTLFLVMVGYGSLEATTNQEFERALFVIDNAYYGTKYRRKYLRRFENELMGKPMDHKESAYWGSLFFFENGTYVSRKKKLPQDI